MFLDTSDLKSEEIFLRLRQTAEGDLAKGWVPAYHFAICLPDGTEVGLCDLRLGHNQKLYYGGNIGYRVHPKYRGHRYAAKACRLLFNLARRHGLGYVYITCNPENTPSRRTCEILGGTLVEIADLPEDNDMYRLGERIKCIFRYEL